MTEAVAKRGLTLGLTSLRTYGLVIAILLISVYFYLQNPAFASSGNIFQLLRAMASLAMIAFAQLLVIISGELDLSVGSVYGLTAVSFGVIWLGLGNSPLDPTHILFALIVALGIALACGATNAFFTAVVGIPSFIATLGMLSMAQGIELLLSNAGSFNPAYVIPPPDPDQLAWFRWPGFTRLPFEIPMQVLWLAVAFVVFWILRHRTLFGFRLLAIGGNTAAAAVTRINITKY